jgi:DNA-directed RNA polymerase II subunit RPB11
VSFAAYRVPHPLEHNVVVRVQTEEGYEPWEAAINAANVLLVQLTQLRSNFEQECELKKISGGDDAEY